MTPLADQLAALPHPAAPPDFTKAVLARIERIESIGAASGVNVRQKEASSSARDWSAWMMVAGALVAVLGMYATESLAVLAMPESREDALVLAGGLVLYALALFAPLGFTRARAASSLRRREAP